MPKITVCIDSKFGKDSFVRLIKSANEEMAILSLVQDVKHTYPNTCLLVGLLNGIPKGKVKMSVTET